MKTKRWNSIIAELIVFCFAISCADPNNIQRRYGDRSHEWQQNGQRRSRWHGQCPCVKKKDTGECVTYDPRFQATTIEEAIVNFPDLQMSVPNTISASSSSGFGPTSQNGSISVSAFARSGPTQNAPAVNGSVPPLQGLCGDNQECKACSAVLLNRLSNTGILEGTQLDQLAKRQQLPARRGCEKYHFGRTPTSAYSRVATGLINSTGKLTDPVLDNLFKQLQEKGEENWRKKQAQSNRTKRQSSSKPGTTLGQQFKIDCSKRGEPVEQGSTWVGLCNVCWAWRKLPASYFPQYVNELICDKDTKCMSGWGSCQQRYKSVDILQNTASDANPSWKQVTISVANYCDCEVESGSSMHNFVAA